MEDNVRERGKDRAIKLWLVLLIVLAAFLIKPQTAKADIASGTWGTCHWTISDGGTLTIGPGTGADTINDYGKYAPWSKYGDSITSVKESGTIVLPNNSSYLFSGLSEAKSIDTSNLNTKNVTNMFGMFFNCPSLTSLDVSKFNTKNVTNMQSMFNNCSSLTSLDVSNFNTENVTNMQRMFYDCSSLTSLDVSNFNTEKVTDMSGVFYWCRSLTSLDVSNFNTEKATDMSCMFQGCSSLTSLDVSNFNTEKVTDMRYMFARCLKLSSLDVSNFNTANVTYMEDMFSDCVGLTSLNVSNFNTANVTYMDGMFFNCSSLTSLDVSSFNTANVRGMLRMFEYCSSLSSLDLSSFDTTKVQNMRSMFYDCSSLSSLDLSNFNTENATGMADMFYDCSSLKSIKLGSKSGLINKGGSESSYFNRITPKANTGEDITYTGKWTKASPYNHADSISGFDLQRKYATNSSDFGNFEEATWVWEIEGQDPYGQKYSSDDGITDGKHNVVSLTSGTPAETQIDAFATDKDGNKTGYWTKLDDDTWTYTFYVYKAKVPWRVYEDSLAGYTGNYTKASPLDIKKGTDEAIITNTSNKIAKQKYGTLKITKKLNGSAATNVSFSFEITLTDENGNVLSGNTMFGGTAFSNGKATVSVDAGSSIEISGIPARYHYSIKEIHANGYIQESFTNQSDTMSEGTIEAVCTNKYVSKRDPSHADETVNLTINKICESQTDKFKFSINISNINAGESVAAEIKATSSSSAQKKTYTPDNSGEINEEAEISGTGSIVLSGIPVGAKYRITEEDTPYIASYSIADANNKGLINKPEDANDAINASLSTMEETADSGENVNITFTNTKPKYPVSFTKRNEKDDFVEGAVLEVSSSDGTKITSWTTVAGESKEIDLEPGTYTLHEISAPSGYGIASDIQFTVSDDGKIITGGAEVSDIEMIDANTEKTVSVSKVDDSGFPVQGAELKLTDSGTGKTIDSWKTESVPHDVKLEFGKTYVLSETAAPSGYEKAADIKLAVSSDGKLTVDGKAADGDAIYMTDLRKPYILPSTGGSGNLRMMAFLIAAASIFVLSAALEKTRRDRDD